MQEYRSVGKNGGGDGKVAAMVIVRAEAIPAEAVPPSATRRNVVWFVIDDDWWAVFRRLRGRARRGAGRGVRLSVGRRWARGSAKRREALGEGRGNMGRKRDEEASYQVHDCRRYRQFLMGGNEGGHVSTHGA